MDRLSFTSPGNSNFSVTQRYSDAKKPLLSSRFDDAPLHNDRYESADSCSSGTYDRKMMMAIRSGHAQTAETSEPLDLDPGKFGDAAVQGKDLAMDVAWQARRSHIRTQNAYRYNLAPLDTGPRFRPQNAGPLQGVLSKAHRGLGGFGVAAGFQDLLKAHKDLSEGNADGFIKLATGTASLGQGGSSLASLTSGGRAAVSKLSKTALKGAGKWGLTLGSKTAVKIGLGRIPILGAAVTALDGSYDIRSYNRAKAAGKVTKEDELKRDCGIAKLVGAALQTAGVALALGCPPLGLAVMAAGSAVSIGADLVANSKTVREVGKAGMEKVGQATRATGNFLGSLPGKLGEGLEQAARGLNPMPGVYHRLAQNRY